MHFFIHHITKPIKYSAGINYSKREIVYQLNRAYITLVLLQCIGDVCCEARSRDVNSSEKTTKTTLASSSSLAPCLFLWRGSWWCWWWLLWKLFNNNNNDKTQCCLCVGMHLVANWNPLWKSLKILYIFFDIFSVGSN